MSHVQSQPMPPELQLCALQEQVKSLHQTVGAVVNLFTLLRLHMEGQSEKLHADANPRMHDHANQIDEWAAQVELLTNTLADSTWERVGSVVRGEKGDVA